MYFHCPLTRWPQLCASCNMIWRKGFKKVTLHLELRAISGQESWGGTYQKEPVFFFFSIENMARKWSFSATVDPGDRWLYVRNCIVLPGSELPKSRPLGYQQFLLNSTFFFFLLDTWLQCYEIPMPLEHTKCRYGNKLIRITTSESVLATKLQGY